MTNRTCKVEGCPRGGKFIRGLCPTHYSRLRKTGTVGPAESMVGTASMSLRERLARIGWDEVVRRPELGPCWEWKGARHPQGYGHLRVHNRVQPAHRLALEVATGPIPPELHACHRCDNPPCVNPAHLYAGTPSQNTVDFYDRSGIQRPRGEDHPMVKLTDTDVGDIRSRYAAGGILKRELATEYGVHPDTIGRIINRRSRA